MAWEQEDQEYPRFRDARSVLSRRGISFDSKETIVRRIAGELARRGWRWSVERDEARAEKAYTPTGTVTHTVIAHGSNQEATMATVLADAIRFDEEHGLSSLSPYRADIVVRDINGQTVALVEIKNRQELTPQVATQFRRNLFVHGLVGHRVPYFLLVSQDAGYLWSSQSVAQVDAPPNVGFSMAPIVAHYLPWLAHGERLGEAQLELVVVQWLDDLATERRQADGGPESDLEPTGFLETINRAIIVSNRPS